MSEISGIVLDFLNSKAKEIKLKQSNEKKFIKEKWYPIKEFNDFLKKFAEHKNKTIYTQLGEEFYTFAINNNIIAKEDNVKEAVINLHKLYIQILRGEGIGIWKSSKVQEGFAKVEENSLLPELFTKGLLNGILKNFNCVGPIVKQIKSREENDENYFNEFDLTWMKKIK